MKVVWIADYFITDMIGGAELEDDYIIREAIKRGYEVVKVGPDTPIPTDANLFVLANMERFRVPRVLDEIGEVPYVRFEHDLRLPRNAWLYDRLGGKALINVFHSPAHRDEVFRLSNASYHYFLHPLCLDERFRDLGLARKNNPVLYVGWVCHPKGSNNMSFWLQTHPDREIDVYGKGDMRNPRMHYKEWISQDELVRVYNSYESLIFLPAELQACSRVMAEAYLCKVPNLIHNNRTGFDSYGWTYSDYDTVRDLIINGAKYWWEKVEEELRKKKK